MSDSAAATASSAAAPADERYDAQVNRIKSGLGELIPSPALQPVIDYIEAGYADRQMAKSGNVVRFPNSSRRAGPQKPRSILLDEYQVVAQGAYWDRPGILGFDGMKSVVEGTPILNGILLTSIRQVGRFCRPRTDRAQAGFVIEPTQKGVEIGDDQRRSMQLLERFLVNGGWKDDPRIRKRLKRDTFSSFTAMSVRDTLTMDACPIETIFKRDRNLGLDGFVAVSGLTIRLRSEEGYQGDDEVFAVKVVQGQIRAAYNYDQLVYEVRNPRSDVTAWGYGYSETRMLIKVVTYPRNTMTYNESFFDTNTIPRGILQIFGSMRRPTS